MKDEERGFYEIEASQQGWTLRELKRQFNAGLYERLALSCDQHSIRALAHRGQHVAQPLDLLKEPYFLEFLDRNKKPGTRSLIWNVPSSATSRTTLANISFIYLAESNSNRNSRSGLRNRRTPASSAWH